jgi:hypothetical protein
MQKVTEWQKSAIDFGKHQKKNLQRLRYHTKGRMLKDEQNKKPLPRAGVVKPNSSAFSSRLFR